MGLNDVWARLTTPHITLNAVQNVIRFRRLPWLAPGGEDEVGPSNLVRRWDLAFCCAIACKATNPKDLIYGAIGLTHIDMKPDYGEDKTTGDVYGEFAAKWLQVAQLPPVVGCTPQFLAPLMFLAAAGTGLFGQIKGLISWAPNFGAEAGSSLHVGGSDKSPDEGLFVSDNNIAFIKGPSLFVHGVVVGKVLHVSEAPTGATQTDGRMRSFIADFKERHPLYITGIPPLQAIFRFVCRDTSSEVRRITTLKALAFLHLLGSQSPGDLVETLPALGFPGRLADIAEQGGANLRVRIEFNVWFNDSFFPELNLGQPLRRDIYELHGITVPKQKIAFPLGGSLQGSATTPT